MSRKLLALLKADRGRLWNRAAAALQVNPNRARGASLGCFDFGNSTGRRTANSWLQDATKNYQRPLLLYIQGLLTKLNGEVTKSQILLSSP